MVSASDPESAFLGPKLWDKAIPLPVLDTVDTEFSIMNIDDFLNENNISLDDEDDLVGGGGQGASSSSSSSGPSTSTGKGGKRKSSSSVGRGGGGGGGGAGAQNSDANSASSSSGSGSGSPNHQVRTFAIQRAIM